MLKFTPCEMDPVFSAFNFSFSSGLNHPQICEVLTSTMTVPYDLFCRTVVNQIRELLTKIMSEFFDLSYYTAVR